MEFKKTEIILCSRCGGTGSYLIGRPTIKDLGEYVNCDACGGSGRVRRNTTEEILPYKPKGPKEHFHKGEIPLK